ENDQESFDQLVARNTAIGRRTRMNTHRSHPPRLAAWLLRHLCPGRNREAIAGDLLERFAEGRSDGWFWRQVLVEIVVGASSQFRLWTETCVAAAGTALIWCVP